jgi:hypothetical protein
VDVIGLSATGSVPGLLIYLALCVLLFRFRREFARYTAWNYRFWSFGKGRPKSEEWIMWNARLAGALAVLFFAVGLFGLIVLLAT